MERTWDRSGTHGEHMGWANLTLAGQFTSLTYAEAVLFVDDSQAESAKQDAFLNQRVRTDQNIDFSVLQLVQHGSAFSLARTPCEQSDRDIVVAGLSEKAAQSRVELPSKDFGRCHNRGLVSGHFCLEDRCCRND